MKTRGFTILELVLVMVVIAIVGGMLVPWMANTAQAYNMISSRKSMLGQVRAGFERMVGEIRLIPGRPQVISLGAANFQFQYPTGTAITYSVTGTNLMRNSDIMVNNVTSLGFTYYDESGAVTATAANVRSVGIQLVATTATSTTPYTVRTRVFLRNTGNHYSNYTSP